MPYPFKSVMMISRNTAWFFIGLLFSENCHCDDCFPQKAKPNLSALRYSEALLTLPSPPSLFCISSKHGLPCMGQSRGGQRGAWGKDPVARLSSPSMELKTARGTFPGWVDDFPDAKVLNSDQVEACTVDQ